MKIKGTLKATIVITNTYDLDDNTESLTNDESKEMLTECLSEYTSENGTVEILEFSMETEEVKE